MNKNNPNEIVLEIKNLFKKFENKIILNDLNFKISRGKSIGVMGPSGTGKSILLKCILGLTEYNGQILYNLEMPYTPSSGNKKHDNKKKGNLHGGSLRLDIYFQIRNKKNNR